MKKFFQDALEQTPIIAAIKNDEGLERCLQSDCMVVFILYGNICNIADIVDRVKEGGKVALVHTDLIDGLNYQEIVVDFIKKNTRADGIITTKSTMIRRARELNLCTVLRFFVLDSMAYENISKQVKNVTPDAIEVLPGMMPKIISKICSQSKVPVIAGGLVTEKGEVYELLKTGVISVSTTKTSLWFV